MRTVKVLVGFLVLLAAGALSLPSAASAEGGICPELGCVGGEAKCADGSFVISGITVYYTCYTEIRPE